MTKINPSTEISGRRLAQILGLTAARVRQLASDGVIPRKGRDLFDLEGAIAGYVGFLKADQRRANANPAQDAVRDARAEEIKQRIAEKARTLIPAAEAAEALDEITSVYISALDGLSARFTRDAKLRRQLQEKVEQIRAEIFAILDKKIIELRSGTS
ncbi:MAG: hypothetical protein JWM36_3217 [Hyphomicrobiales bacterium]|nr:hypothetical protein [Hyphomicrobiales bacterium]